VGIFWLNGAYTGGRGRAYGSNIRVHCNNNINNYMLLVACDILQVTFTFYTLFEPEINTCSMTKNAYPLTTGQNVKVYTVAQGLHSGKLQS
jgi:hypothetical protein